MRVERFYLIHFLEKNDNSKYISKPSTNDDSFPNKTSLGPYLLIAFYAIECSPHK